MTAFTITATDNGDAATLAGGGPVAITVTLPSTSVAGVQSVVAGTNVTVDSTDPANPIVSATGGGGGTDTVDTVVAGTGISVDSTDPANPVVTNTGATAAQGALADSATQPADLGTAAIADTGDFDAAGAAAAAQAAAIAASQPVDSDLTAIAALTTTGYGRAVLALADQAAIMALLSSSSATASGVVELATSAEALTGTDTVRAVTPAALQAKIDALVNSAPGLLDTLGEIATQLSTDESAVTALTTTVSGKLAKASNLSDLASASTARTNLGLGSAALSASADFQPVDSDLTSIAALTTTAYGRAFLELANAAAARTALALGTAAVLNTGTSSGDIPLLSTGGVLPIARLATGTPTGSKFVRDDGTLQVPGGGGSVATDTIFDAKGDLAVGTAADTAAKLTVGTDGKALVADSTTTTGLAYKSLAPTDDIPWLSGSLYGCPYGNFVSSTATPTANDLVLMPFPVGRSFSLTALAATAATSGTGVLRLGIYSSGSNGLPSTLLFEAGTVTPGAGAGVKTVAATQTLSPGLYWVAYLVDSANGTFRVFTAINRALFGWDNLSPGSMNLCLRATGVTAGALPSTCPTLTPTSAVNPIRVFAVAA